MAKDPIMIKYWNEQFGVDIQIIDMEPASYFEMLSLKFAAGEIPDVFTSNLSRDRGYFEQGVLAVIPEQMILTNLPGIYKQFNDAYPDFLNFSKIDGQIISIPSYVAQPYRQPIVYRTDWIKKVGKTGTPRTLVELEELMYLFTNNDPDGNGRKDTYGLSDSAFNLVYGAFGQVPGQWNQKGGALVYSSIQSEMKDALAVLAKWYKDGVIDPEFITGENKGGYWAVSHAFADGRIGLSMHGNFYHWYDERDLDVLDDIEVLAPKNLLNLNTNPMIWGEPVSGPAGKKGVSIRHPVEGQTFAMGRQVQDDPEKMAMILHMEDVICSPENCLTAYFGFEGEHWSYNAEGVPMFREDIRANNWMASQGGHTIMRRFFSTTTDRMTNPVRYPFMEAHNLYNDGYLNELLIGLPSSGTYQSELTKIETEAYLAIITGQRPLSYFDEFVAQWKRGGGDILTREANAWWSSMK
jgi:putative aldouronate transport system substrate-binding protein